MFAFVLCLSVLSLALPTHPLTAMSDITTRNNGPTTPTLATALRFNIDPDVYGVACGRQFLVNINVKDAGSASSTSSTCNGVRDLLVGSDNKGSSDVNLIFTCPGQTLSTGLGDRDIKIVLNTEEMPRLTDVHTTTPGTMTVTSEKAKFVVTTPVEVGMSKSSNSELLWQYITCH
jgi:hypothetical protein